MTALNVPNTLNTCTSQKQVDIIAQIPEALPDNRALEWRQEERK